MDPKKLYLEETSKRKDVWRSAAEVAGELTRLAAEINDGALIIDGEKLPVGDTFSFTMQKQLKKGRICCEFSLRTNVAAQDASPGVAAAAEDRKAAHCPATGGKKLKKEISRLWKEVVKQVEGESLLAREVATELRQKCEDYNLCAHSRWFDAWRRCAAAVQACTVAAERGDFTAARSKISEVNHLTRECHRLYK